MLIDPLHLAIRWCRVPCDVPGTGTVDFRGCENPVYENRDYFLEIYPSEQVVVGQLYSAGIETRTEASCTVTNTSDSGPGSLRAAIHCANAMPGSDPVEIRFAIDTVDENYVDVDSHLPGGDAEPDVFVIGLETALPALTRGGILINGQSQQAQTGDTNPFGPEIVITGAGLAGNGLELRSSGNRVHALNILGFAQNGILIEGRANTVTGSFLGVDPTGTVAAPNTGNGVVILNGDGNQIGGPGPHDGNVISGNLHYGVWIVGNSVAWPAPGEPPIFTDNPDQFRYVGNTVAGNIIGLGSDGSMEIGNGAAGVFIQDSANNRIGGNSVAERNVISANLALASTFGARPARAIASRPTTSALTPTAIQHAAIGPRRSVQLRCRVQHRSGSTATASATRGGQSHFRALPPAAGFGHLAQQRARQCGGRQPDRHGLDWYVRDPQ